MIESLPPGGAVLDADELEARQAIHNHDGDPTWLAYAVYGSPAARATLV